MTATKQREKAHSSAAPVPAQPEAARAALSEAELIERNLAEGLAQIERQRADHQARLSAIAARLVAIPDAIEEAEVPLVKLRREQERLPQELATARALAEASVGTQATQHVQDRLATLQARTEDLPRVLAEAKVTREETLATLAREQHQLEQERATVQRALSDLAARAAAQHEAAQQAQQHLKDATFASIQSARQAARQALEAAEAHAAEARAALADLDKEAQVQLSPWPDLKLSHQRDYLPVNDLKAQRLRTLLEYRRAFASWVAGDNWSLGYPPRWFLIPHVELGYPDQARLVVTEIEQALAAHIREVQQRLR